MTRGAVAFVTSETSVAASCRAATPSMHLVVALELSRTRWPDRTLATSNTFVGRLLVVVSSLVGRRVDAKGVSTARGLSPSSLELELVADEVVDLLEVVAEDLERELDLRRGCRLSCSSSWSLSWSWSGVALPVKGWSSSSSDQSGTKDLSSSSSWSV